MKCNAPTVAFRQPGINPATGKHYPPVSFRVFSKIFKEQGISNLDYRVKVITDYYNSCPRELEPVLMPCKRCILCTRNYRRQWAYRLCCEARTSGESMFLTLTCDDVHLPSVFPGGRLSHRPFQLFFKRLRKLMSTGYEYQFVPPLTDSSLIGRLPRTMQLRHYKRDCIRYYMCGEYGDTSHRPHYHACVFGCRFPDAYFQKEVSGEAYYTSPTLQFLWPYGFALFSDVTPRSASYVCGYVDKKCDAVRWCPDNGADDGAREYVRMSHGLGLDYLKRYHAQLYRFDSLGDVFGEFHSAGNIPVQAPKYFDEKYQLLYPQNFDKIVASRERRRLARLSVMDVPVDLSESCRVNAVLMARRRTRDFRELAEPPLSDIKA